MSAGRTWMFLLIFALLALQMLLSMIQVRHYQRAVREMLGTGLLGIGQRKGGLKSGEILILSYDRKADRVVGCKSMKGLTVMATFKPVPAYVGLSLAEVREAGVRLDAVEMRRYRRKHPYDPYTLSKKKGALIQAVEAIELRLRNDAASASEPEASPEALPSPIS